MRSRPSFWPVLLGTILSACASGGSPPPASVATSPLDTPEYRRSSAAVQSNVLPAWEAGRSGAGVTVGIVDTGIAAGSPEFAGRIHPASRDVTGAGRPISDEDGHGTAVTAVLAAARNGQSIVGIAPEARLAVMRGDRQGTCASQGGCRFSDASVAAGVDAATDAGARAINLSLGGSPGSPVLRSAFARAASRGVVLVISAGNDGGPEPDVFPRAALASADPRHVIIVGAATAAREIADFSNRAGPAAANFLLAPGVSVRSFDELGTEMFYSGGSIATPVVTGAIALLAEAFPNLSGASLVEILLESADDLGAPGVDPIYGRGLLNIGRAFRPLGPTMLAGTRIAVSGVDNGALGPPMGDGTGFTSALGTLAVVDRFDRRFALDVAPTLKRPGAGRLAGALADVPASAAAIGLARGPTRFRIAGVIRSPAAGLPAGADIDAPLGLAQRGLGPRSAAARHADTGLALEHRPWRLAAGTGLAAPLLPGETATPALVARDALAAGGSAAAIAARALAGARIGPLEAAVAHSSATRTLTPSLGLAPRATTDRSSLALRFAHPGLETSLVLASEREDGALLGTRLAPAFGLLGSEHRYLGGAVDLALGDLRLRGAIQQGWHEARLAPGLVLREGRGIRSSAWSASATLPSALGTLTFGVSAPQAVVAGGFTVAPADGTTRFAPLAVAARERAGELALTRGPLALHLYARGNAGHHAGLTDTGLALRFSTGF